MVGGLGPGEGTWTCHVCGKTRPDDKISVHTQKLGVVTVNVRYCNDRSECCEGAPGIGAGWLAPR